MLADEFTKIFREEHREIRDALLGLNAAFQQRDMVEVRRLLGKTARLSGPHFRYEEEVMYPALVQVFGEEYVASLYKAHDGVISASRRLVQLGGKSKLSDADVAEAQKLIRAVLPHVSDCDGLSIMVETFPAEEVAQILAARTSSLGEGLDLLTWADQVRSGNLTAHS